MVTTNINPTENGFCPKMVYKRKIEYSSNFSKYYNYAPLGKRKL